MMAVLGLTNGMNVTIAFESGRKTAQKVDAEMIGELSGPGSTKTLKILSYPQYKLEKL